MAAYDLEEQEQLEELKTWWRLHGNLVTGIITLLACAVLAWQGWNWWQRNQHHQAASTYPLIQDALMQGDAKRARELAGSLLDQYGGTSYAPMAVLLAAKAQVDAGDAKSARAQLEWAATQAKDEAIREIARLRLVALLIDEKAYADAAARLAAAPVQGFEVRHAELRGDLLLAQGKGAEARSAYVAALDLVEQQIKTAGDADKRAWEAARELLGSKHDIASPGENK